MECWVLVFNNVATMEEINRSWSYDDIMKGIAMLTFKDEFIKAITPKGNK